MTLVSRAARKQRKEKKSDPEAKNNDYGLVIKLKLYFTVMSGLQKKTFTFYFLVI